MDGGQGGMFDPPPTILAVSKAVVKKVAVAINDRGDNRDRPQSICPDVHPRPFYRPE